MGSEREQRMAEFDIGIMGATGFTGRQLAAELSRRAPSGARILLGGRNLERLERVAAPLDLPVCVVDSLNPGQVEDFVSRCRVVVSTVGPFARYGDPLVDACVAQGVHYLDITGEVPWARQVIDRHHARAAEQGTLLLPFSGFDSVPSDLGVWFMVQQLAAQGQQTRQVLSAFSIKGGFNGGTLASALNMAESFPARALAHPFWLDPEPPTDRETLRAHSDPSRPTEHPQLGALAPFFMGSVNTRVVRRSAALAAQAGRPYGPEFAYQEYMRMSSPAQAWAATAAMGLGVGLLRSKVGRKLAARLGPAPGEGPSEAEMDGGFVKVRYAAQDQDGRWHKATLQAAGDPGNRVTVRILAQATLAVAEGEGLPGGVLTPAFALGQGLLDRLESTGEWSLKLDS